MTQLAVLRDVTVGTDFMGYKEDFLSIVNEKSYKYIRHNFEIGYYYSILLFKTFSSDYKLFVSLWFIPCMVGVIKFMSDHNTKYAFGLFFYLALGFYFSSYNIMRQMAAISICMMFLPKLYEKKYVFYALAIIITSLLFHKSELMFLLLIPIHYWISQNDKPLYKLPLYLLVCSSFLVFYVGNTFLKNLLSEIIHSLFGGDRYTIYILGVNEDLSNGSSLLITVLTMALIYVKNPNNYQFLTYVYVFSTVLFNVFNTFSVYSTRISLSFMFVAIVLFPQIFFDKYTKCRHTFIFVSLLLVLIYFINCFHIKNSGEINPYMYRVIF